LTESPKPNSYEELYTRNWPIIPKEVQIRLSSLRIAVAGCGSTGGAFIEGAIRAGIQNFQMCDNGSYEVSNLNRQLVSQKQVGVNKAVAYKNKIFDINPSATIKTWDSGLSLANMDEFLADTDFLFDAVDVTTSSGMDMKLHLHEAAARKKIPTGSALDLGYTQWLQSYNYQDGVPALGGKLADARKAKTPLKALILGFSPVEELPLEISDELIRLLENPDANACQLACVCFLLAGMVTPYLISFVKKQKLPALVAIDLMKYFESEDESSTRNFLCRQSHVRLREILSSLP
jgi:hypothetical protein